jgi:hypothetical protein
MATKQRRVALALSVLAAAGAVGAAGLATAGGAEPDARGAKPAPRSAASVDFRLGAKSRPAIADKRLLRVVATGIGADADKAKQNAFSNAVEQAVGVLVDSETLIRNERIVSDRVLTFTRGYVRDFRVMRSWRQDGVHHARIWALVAVGELSGKLQANRIAVREVPGELLYRQAKLAIRNEAHAAEMFRKAMAEFRMETLLKVDIVGKPRIVAKDETHAKLRVKLKVTSDMEAWQKLSRNLTDLLGRVTDRQVAFSTTRQKRSPASSYYGSLWPVDAKKLAERLKGTGVPLYVLKSANPSASVTQWRAFLVPKPVGAVVRDVEERLYRRVCITFTDAEGNTVEQAKRDFSTGGTSRGKIRLIWWNQLAGPPPYWVGPLMCIPTSPYSMGYTTELAQEEDVEIGLSKLRKVARCVVSIEDKPGK